MTALPLFARHFRDLGLHGDGVVSVSPDAGRAKQAVRFAEMIEADFAIMHKSRPAHDVAAVTEIAGRVRGKRRDPRRRRDHDRRHDARERRGAQGAGRERGVALRDPRPLLRRRPRALRRVRDIKGIVVTDTVPIDPLTQPDKLTVLPVSGLLAETIMNVFADDSVSAIFGGENQLF